jgi:hypothetical protein
MKKIIDFLRANPLITGVTGIIMMMEGSAGEDAGTK